MSIPEQPTVDSNHFIKGPGKPSHALNNRPESSTKGILALFTVGVEGHGVEFIQLVDYVNAHGTSTAADATEPQAIKTVFKDHAKKLPVSSTKSMTGHLLGAAGGVEAIYSLMAIKNRTLPPTINYTTPDPECDLDYVPNHAREANVDICISNSFGFGGTNGVLIFKKFSG